MESNAGRNRMFVSARYDVRGVTPDDVQPDICFAKNPDVCTGVLLFDILIANPDRHRKNLKVDDPRHPRRIEVFDHDRALFGVWPGEGEARLGRLVDRLGSSGGSETHENANCLLGVVDTSDHFEKWLQRIAGIPDWFVNDICDEVKMAQLTTQELAAAKWFLQMRKRTLRKIIRDNQHAFPGIRSWGLPI